MKTIEIVKWLRDIQGDLPDKGADAQSSIDSLISVLTGIEKELTIDGYMITSDQLKKWFAANENRPEDVERKGWAVLCNGCDLCQFEENKPTLPVLCECTQNGNSAEQFTIPATITLYHSRRNILPLLSAWLLAVVQLAKASIEKLTYQCPHCRLRITREQLCKQQWYMDRVMRCPHCGEYLSIPLFGFIESMRR